MIGADPAHVVFTGNDLSEVGGHGTELPEAAAAAAGRDSLAERTDEVPADRELGCALKRRYLDGSRHGGGLRIGQLCRRIVAEAPGLTGNDDTVLIATGGERGRATL